MRERLAPLDGKQAVFFATFARFGWRTFRGRYVGKTALFLDVRDSRGNQLADHLWFKVGKGLDSLGLKEGDAVSFSARVGSYQKRDGYDYHLVYPRDLKKVDKSTLREEGQEALL
jgi:hypothetical protein